MSRPAECLRQFKDGEPIIFRPVFTSWADVVARDGHPATVETSEFRKTGDCAKSEVNYLLRFDDGWRLWVRPYWMAPLGASAVVGGKQLEKPAL